MLTENEKREMAQDAGWLDDLYSDRVKEGVKKIHPHPEDEIAILRKAVAYLFELISKFHIGELNNAEFVEYNAIVEQIKAKTKAELF